MSTTSTNLTFVIQTFDCLFHWSFRIWHLIGISIDRFIHLTRVYCNFHRTVFQYCYHCWLNEDINFCGFHFFDMTLLFGSIFFCVKCTLLFNLDSSQFYCVTFALSICFSWYLIVPFCAHSWSCLMHTYVSTYKFPSSCWITETPTHQKMLETKKLQCWQLIPAAYWLAPFSAANTWFLPLVKITCLTFSKAKFLFFQVFYGNQLWTYRAYLLFISFVSSNDKLGAASAIDLNSNPLNNPFM